MMDLDQIYFDNPLRSYLLLVAVVLFAILFRKYLSQLVTSLLFIPVKRLSNTTDRLLFRRMVIRPLGTVLVIIVTALALDRLYFPSILKFNVYKVTSQQIIDTVIICIITVAFINLLIKSIDFSAIIINERTKSDREQHQLLFFFKDFIKVLIIIIGIILVLKFAFNARVGELITGLSIVGAALALAAKESLENLIASFIIFFDKPFTTGDMVRVNNFQGFVERIGLRSTRLRTADKTLVTVPNKQMVDSILDNWSMREHVRNEIKVDVSPMIPAQKLEEMIAEIKRLFEQRGDMIISPNVFLSEINKNGSMITAEYFTPYATESNALNLLRHQLNLEIKKISEPK